jgi:molybdate transport system substrate-binding protein
MKRLSALVWVLALAGCGDSGTLSPAGGRKPPLAVSAASSLREPLTACAGDFADADVRLRFGPSGALAHELRRGAPVDVFASADAALPEELAARGKLEPPVRFAKDRLVVAVPAGGSPVTSLADLSRPGVSLVIGAKGVPVGDATRQALGRLPAHERDAVLANVRSEEPGVKRVVMKLEKGEADAGFVYATDVKASGGRLAAIDLPHRLRPTATYAAGVAGGADQPDLGDAFVDDLLAGGCHRALLAAGFAEP